MRLSEYILSSQKKPLLPIHNVLVVMGKVWHPCHTHKLNTYENLFFILVWRTTCSHWKM